MSRDVTEVTKWAMVELIRESGYLSLENISLGRSHSVVNRSQVDDKRKARFSIVLTRDLLVAVIDVTLMVKEQTSVCWFTVNTCY